MKRDFQDNPVLTILFVIMIVCAIYAAFTGDSLPYEHMGRHY